MRNGEFPVICFMHFWLITVADNGFLKIKRNAEIIISVSDYIQCTFVDFDVEQ